MPDAPASIDLNTLPPEARSAVEALMAENAALSQQVGELTGRTVELSEYASRLEHLVKEFRQALYGKGSEKLSEDQRQLVFEDIEVAVAEVENTGEEPGATPETTGRKRASAKRNHGRLPEEFERETQVIEPESLRCPCGCGEMVKIGEDRSERLDIVPARFRVIETIRPKYACRTCQDGVHQAPAPAYLIEGAMPTEAMIAHVLVSKYADHLPLYRQAQIYRRAGIDLHRSTLAGWVGKAAAHLAPVVDRLAAHLKSSGKLFMDETRAPVLDPGKGKTKTGYLWALSRDDRGWSGNDPPGIVYFYAPGRGGVHAENFLKGFEGTLQVDGYGGYNRLTRDSREGEPLRLAYCWAHARRKLHEIFEKDASPIAGEGLRRIAEFYRIEADIRGRSPEDRHTIRQAETKPLIEKFGIWLAAQRARVSRKSRLGEKLTYIANHWTGLQVFLDDGRVEIDSNAVENRIRPIALTRKNALFAGHDEGGKAWGRIASLIETAKINDVEPFAYLTATLEAIAAGHPDARIDELMPWAFKTEPR